MVHTTSQSAGYPATTNTGGIASKIPGTQAYDATHPTTTSTGAYGTGAGATLGAGNGSDPYGRGSTVETHTGVSHSGKPTGTTHGATATGGGLASKVPGTDAHAATHGHHSTHAANVHSSAGLQPGARGTTTTTTTTTVPTPSAGDKIKGKIDVAVGKVTHNPGKVAQGEILQHEGKVGLQQSGIAGGTTTGHHVGGTTGTGTGRY